MTALGTFRGTINELTMPPGMVAEEEDEEDDDSLYEVDGHSSIVTDAATRGSDPLVASSLGMNADAAHSTMIIKPLRSASEPVEDAPSGSVYTFFRCITS